jgi:hypothetical protein
LEAVASVEVRLGNSAALVSAADTIGKAAHAFADAANGDRLAAIDPLLPQPQQYKK